VNQKIIFLRGLPGSGKSTWAKQYCLDNPDFVRINKDDIRILLGNFPFSNKFENQVLAFQRQVGCTILSLGKSIIVDDTNFAEKHWQYWSEISESMGISVEIKFFDTPLWECIERDLNREYSVGKSVICSMYNKYLHEKT
jgi:predicted kinase